MMGSGFFVGIVDDYVVQIRLYNPEADRRWSQLFSHSSHMGRVGKKITSAIDSFLNPVGGGWIVLRDKGPNFEEIGHSLRRELILAHPRRGLSDCTRFNSASLDRTASGSINSPRWAAAYPSPILASISARF